MTTRTFTFNVTSSSGPTWFSDANLLTKSWVQLPNADLTSISLIGAGDTTQRGLSFSTSPSGNFDFSGGVVDPINQQLLITGGGHSSGNDNGVYALPLMESSPRWRIWTNRDFPAIPTAWGTVPMAMLKADQTVRLESYAGPSNDIGSAARAYMTPDQRTTGGVGGTGGPPSQHSYQNMVWSPIGDNKLWICSITSGSDSGYTWNFPPEATRPVGWGDTIGANCYWRLNESRRLATLPANHYAQSAWTNTPWDLVVNRNAMNDFYSMGSSVWNPHFNHIVSMPLKDDGNRNRYWTMNPATNAWTFTTGVLPDRGAVLVYTANYDTNGNPVKSRDYIGALLATTTSLSIRLIDGTNYSNPSNDDVISISGLPTSVNWMNQPGMVWHEASQAFLVFGIYSDSLKPVSSLWKLRPNDWANPWGAWTCTEVTKRAGSAEPYANPSGSPRQLYGRFNILHNLGGSGYDCLVYAPEMQKAYAYKLPSGGV